MQGYDIESLIKAKKQFELAAEIMEVAIEDKKEHGEVEETVHIVQASECAKEGIEEI